MSTWRENRRAAELAKLRAELVRRLDQLDFRSDNIGQALTAMAQHVECILRLRRSSTGSAASGGAIIAPNGIPAEGKMSSTTQDGSPRR